MALSDKYFIQAKDSQGVTDLIILRQEGYGGPVVEIEEPGGYEDDTSAPLWIEEGYGDESNDFDTPIIQSRRIVHLLAESLLLDDLKNISGADNREWFMVHRRDGVDYWRGWVLPRQTRFGLNRQMKQVISIAASDRLQSIESQTHETGDPIFRLFPPGTLTAAREIIADCLSATGISFPFFDYTSAKPESETGDPLDVLIPQARFWQSYVDDDLTLEERAQIVGAGYTFVFANKRQVLEWILRSFLAQVVQFEGAWHVLYPTGFRLASPGFAITRHYDAAGAATLPVLQQRLVELDEVSWVEDSDDGRGEEPVGDSRTTYDWGRGERAGFENPGFDALAPDNDLVGDPPARLPVGWDYAPDTTYFAAFAPGLTRGADPADKYCLAVVEAETESADPTLAEKRAVAVAFASQSGGLFEALSEINYELAWNFELRTFLPGGQALPPELDSLTAFLRIKWTIGGADYYWVRAEEDPESEEPYDPHLGSFELVAGDDAKLASSYPARYELAARDYVTITQFPGAGFGELTIELGQCVHGQSATPFTSYVCWDKVVLLDRSGEETGQKAITYQEIAPEVTEGLVHQVSLAIGEGPYLGAGGAMWLSDGSAQAVGWKRSSSGAAVPHARMVAQEVLFNRRNSRRTIRLTSAGAVIGASPAKVYEFDGRRYWPIQLTIERPSGRIKLVARELRDDQTTLDSEIIHTDRGDFLSISGNGVLLQNVLTGINEKLRGIVVGSKILYSYNWDGTYDEETGEVTDPGTQGWALTAVTDNGSDADITGVLHFGGGLTGGGGEAGKGGLRIDGGSGRGSQGVVEWYSGGLSGTKVRADGVEVEAEGLAVVLVPFIESPPGRPIRTYGASLTFPQGTTAERPVNARNGDTRYNTDLGCVEMYTGGTRVGYKDVGGSWTCVAGGNAGSVFVRRSSAEWHAAEFQQNQYVQVKDFAEARKSLAEAAISIHLGNSPYTSTNPHEIWLDPEHIRGDYMRLRCTDSTGAAPDTSILANIFASWPCPAPRFAENVLFDLLEWGETVSCQFRMNEGVGHVVYDYNLMGYNMQIGLAGIFPPAGRDPAWVNEGLFFEFNSPYHDELNGIDPEERRDGTTVLSTDDDSAYSATYTCFWICTADATSGLRNGFGLSEGGSGGERKVFHLGWNSGKPFLEHTTNNGATQHFTTAPSTYAAGSWHLLRGRYNNKLHELFVDGVRVAYNFLTGAPDTGGVGTFKVAAISNTASENWQGYSALAYAVKRALTDAECAAVESVLRAIIAARNARTGSTIEIPNG